MWHLLALQCRIACIHFQHRVDEHIINSVIIIIVININCPHQKLKVQLYDIIIANMIIIVYSVFLDLT